jgi:hypothetical protein
VRNGLIHHRIAESECDQQFLEFFDSFLCFAGHGHIVFDERETCLILGTETLQHGSAIFLVTAFVVAVSAHNHTGRSVGTCLHYLQPVVDTTRLHIQQVEHHEINGAPREKELMSGIVHFLTRKVPEFTTTSRT